MHAMKYQKWKKAIVLLNVLCRIGKYKLTKTQAKNLITKQNIVFIQLSNSNNVSVTS